jgi:hypothetical protein
MMSEERESDDEKGKSDPAGGALGKSSRVTVYTPPSPGTPQRICPSPAASMPFWITFPFQVHRRYGLAASGMSSSAFNITVAPEVMTGGKLRMLEIFHPSCVTKKDTDFFCTTSPAEYSTRSRWYRPAARFAGRVIGLC